MNCIDRDYRMFFLRFMYFARRMDLRRLNQALPEPARTEARGEEGII